MKSKNVRFALHAPRSVLDASSVTVDIVRALQYSRRALIQIVHAPPCLLLALNSKTTKQRISKYPKLPNVRPAANFRKLVDNWSVHPLTQDFI